MRLEPVPNPTLARRLGFPLIALALTVLVGSLLSLLAGADPFATFGLIVKGAAGSRFALLETLNRATPLIFTGLAAAVAFRAKLWNIGAEAQLYAGALVTVMIAAGTPLFSGPLLIPFMALAAILAGALVLLGPVILKTRFGVDEVVTTLLINFIMLLLVSLLLEGPMKDPMGMGWPKSAAIAKQARLPRIMDGLRLHWGFASRADFRTGDLADPDEDSAWLSHSRCRAEQGSRTICRDSGECGAVQDGAAFRWSRRPGRIFGSGGAERELTLDLSPGFGYTGIIVAMLALLHPLGVVISALFVAGIFVGADSMSRAAGVPTYIADILLATALLFMVLAILLTRFRMVRD